MPDQALYASEIPSEIPEVTIPPQDELPCDDGIPMETHRHKLQMDFLVDPLINWLVIDQGRGFVGGNMLVYFSPLQVRNQDYRGPDVFVALDVPTRERKSWVVWEEGKGPDIVIELISESTAAQDKTETKEIYQKQLRVPEYFWFDPFNPDDLAGFSLDRGIYQPIQPDNQGHLISQQLDLKLVRWQGVFKAVETTWLRWRTLDGILLPTDREQASAAKQQVNAERQRADAEQQRADRLAERLRSLGVNPEDL